MKMSKGWECPKCGNVFGPQIEECKNCNESNIVGYTEVHPDYEKIWYSTCPQDKQMEFKFNA